MEQAPRQALNVKIEYYGILREVCARHAEEIELDGHSEVTVAEVMSHLVAQHPGLGPHRRYIAFAIDAELVANDTALHDGSTLALLPPVSGG